MNLIRSLRSFSALLPLLGLVSCGGAPAGDNSVVSTASQKLVSSNNTITQAGDEARTGWYPDQTGLDPTIVGGTTFGRIFQTTLPITPNEQVYAQPLVSQDGTRVFIATEADNIYVLDGKTGAVTAQKHLHTPFDPTTVPCGDLLPSIGVTGTPVIDNVTNTAYFLAKGYDAGNVPTWWFHAVDATSLVERYPAVAIGGVANNDPTIAFDAKFQMQRPGLLLLGGVVYAGFGAHCDKGSYHGWVMGFNTTNGQNTARFVTEAGPQHDIGAGIWQSGGGLVSDGPGRIFFVTGNGYAAAPTAPISGSTPNTFLDMSLVRLQVQADNSLKTAQWFAPFDTANLNGQDLDFGSGAPVALPAQYFGTPSVPRLIVAAGKKPLLYVMNRDNLGGFAMGSGGSDLVVSSTQLDAGLWSRPAAYGGDGGYLYVTSNNKPFQALKYGVNGAGVPTFAITGRSADNFGYTSGSPVVTSNGTNPGSGVVWVTFSGGPGQNGQLRAYQAVPNATGGLTQLFADTYGLHAKFTTPGVGTNRIYVGSNQGTVTGYGSPQAGSVSGPLTDFGTVVVNGQKPLTVTLTANQATTVTNLTSTAPSLFAVGASTPALPVALAAGQTMTVQVTFTPTAAVASAASLNVTTSSGPASALALKGVGQPFGPSLSVAPNAITFGGVATGATRTASTIFRNVGSQPLTWQSFTLPAAPYTATGLPAVGSTLASNAEVTVTLTYAPTVAGGSSTTLAATSDGGTQSVFMSGSSGPPPHLTVSTLNLNYGDLAIGQTGSLSFTVTNTGGTDLTITKSKAPVTVPFQAQTTLSEGTIIPAGGVVTETVNITPTVAGTFTDMWILNGNDGGTVQNVVFNATSGNTTPLPRAGWVVTTNPAGGGPANLLDGNPATRWTSGVAQAPGQWISLDMLAAKTFSQVSLDSAANQGDYSRSYQINVSADGVNWGSPIAAGPGTGQLINIPIPTQTARYLRITQTGTANPNWWSVAEISVGAPVNNNAHTPLVRTGWLASASLTGGTDVPGNTLDASLATRWATGQAQNGGQVPGRPGGDAELREAPRRRSRFCRRLRPRVPGGRFCRRRHLERAGGFWCWLDASPHHYLPGTKRSLRAHQSNRHG